MDQSPQTTSTQPRRRTNPLLLLLTAVVVAAIIGVSMYIVQVRQPAEANKEFNSNLVYNVLGLNTVPLSLNERFIDSNNDLVPDGPANPADVIDPPKLVFTYVATNEPETYRERFKEFVEFLSKEVGRPVEYLLLNKPEDEIIALRDGRLHVAGVNTGNIPLAVNECGFVPVCMLAGDTGGSKYKALIIVPADSPIQKLQDLRGKELTLTEPGSNSGFKAPLVLLDQDEKLQPGRDFTIRYSGGHNASIRGIADKSYQAVAVASDLLKRAQAIDPPLIKKDQYRVIYESPKDFPTAGFGYVCMLKPELAAKVKEAFFKFQWKGTGVEREFAASDQTKFSPVSYKEDFELVRRIDDKIRSVPVSELKPDDESSTQPYVVPPPGTEPATAPVATTP